MFRTVLIKILLLKSLKRGLLLNKNINLRDWYLLGEYKTRPYQGW